MTRADQPRTGDLMRPVPALAAFVACIVTARAIMDEELA